MVLKTYYVFVTDDGESEEKCFKRYSYAIPSSTKNLTLMHYKGDDSVAAKLCSENTKPYVRTCPTVLRELEKSDSSPVVYKKKIGRSECPHEYQSVLLPRNQKQISNVQAHYRQRVRISHDALYNLHELSYDIDHFIHKIVTFPDLLVVCGLKHMLKEVNRLLQVQSFSQLLSYDTMFQLGDFYVSTLLFRNVLFDKSPVMPAMFVLHERKLKTTHDEFMRAVAVKISCLVEEDD